MIMTHVIHVYEDRLIHFLLGMMDYDQPSISSESFK